MNEITNEVGSKPFVVFFFFHSKTDLGLRTSEYIFLLLMFTSQNETQVKKGEKRNGWQMCSQI